MQVIVGSEWLAVAYILAALLFIVSLKGLGAEDTAKRGTQAGILGMAVTVAAVYASDYVTQFAFWVIPICIVPTTIIGILYAYSVVTDRLPELVGLFNSFGGLAAALEGVAVYLDRTSHRSMYTGVVLTPTEQKIQLIVLFVSVVVGMVTFTGSIVAVLKLTDAWKTRIYKKSNVSIDLKGIATFSGAHGLNPKDDAMGPPQGEKKRQNRYAVKIDFENLGKYTVYEVLDARRVQFTTGKSDRDFSEGEKKGTAGTATASWTKEVKNWCHIDSKPRVYCGGRAPQLALCALMALCCVLMFTIDKNGMALNQNAESQASWAGVEAEIVGIIMIVILTFAAGAIGVLQALIVSGADMAVVICVLNSGSGWSGVAAGFMISNELLLVTGAFVGASGAILSYLMCQAMNVPILRVLGMIPPPPEKEKTGAAEELPEPQMEEAKAVAERLRAAKTVVIAPGYGMAAGKAQGVVSKLAETLRSQGKQVRFCIHPVAGRLPGHMNILLAEAQVPYDWVCSMDEINNDFKNTDVSICVGAWDTVNPAASEDPDCPVYGMPMCRVWDAKICIVNKRSLGTTSGFSGAQNILPHKENTRMLLGAASDQIQKVLDIIAQDAKQEEGSGGAAQEEAATVQSGPSIHELEAMPTFKTICVPKETCDASGKPLSDPLSEKRCALSPKAALHLRKVLGFHVVAEAGVGERSLYNDDMYRAVGVQIMPTGEKLYKTADVLLKVNPPIKRDDIGKHELDMLKQGATYISFLPVMPPSETPDKCGQQFKDIVLRAQDNKINLLSMGHLPRISRAQKSDAISTFGKLAGHRACLEAASAYGRIMSGEITSAGKNPQAKAWVGGCGVAGLEAVAILKKMGCDVYATDVRDINDQIKSVGGKFVHYDPEGLKKAKDSGGYAPTFGPEMQQKQDAMYAKWAKEVNVMVLTAAIPGMPSPKLVSKAMVDSMQPGSVVVDIAASEAWAAMYEAGQKFGPSVPWPGNCEYTKPGQVFITNNGVKVVGFTDLPSRFGGQATEFYANNLVNLLEDMCAKGTIADRGIKEPVLGTAQDFKIDMHPIRSQTSDHESYKTGEFAIGDDVMAGMCLVKVEDGAALLDCPKKRKPMETAQVIFEKEVKNENLSVDAMEAKLLTLTQKSGISSAAIKNKFSTADVNDIHKIVKGVAESAQKCEAANMFAEAKLSADKVKWLGGMIKKQQAADAKADKEARLAQLKASKGKGDGPLPMIITSAVGLGFFALMAFYPFPAYFIGNTMIFLLAGVLGYCLVANVKASLHTPLMSMSNAISGIVIIGGMFQIQGKYLWGGEGLATVAALEGFLVGGGAVSEDSLDGGITVTKILGSIAVAISAINIAGGFAVTFRMLDMFKPADKQAKASPPPPKPAAAPKASSKATGTAAAASTVAPEQKKLLTAAPTPAAATIGKEGFQQVMPAQAKDKAPPAPRGRPLRWLWSCYMCSGAFQTSYGSGTE